MQQQQRKNHTSEGPRPRATYRAWKRNNAVKWIGVSTKFEEDKKQFREIFGDTTQEEPCVLQLRVREDPLRFKRTLYPGFYPEHTSW